MSVIELLCAYSGLCGLICSGDVFHTRLQPFMRDFERGKSIIMSLERCSDDGCEKLASAYQSHGISTAAGLFKGLFR